MYAEAKRRLAESMTRAESALADFLEASEQIDYARQLIASYEGHQQRALASLIDAVGRDQASELTGVDERQIRAAVAQARTPTGEGQPHEETAESEPEEDKAEPDVAPDPAPAATTAPEAQKEPQPQAS